MGYIDLQVNGYGGVDFNQDRLGAEELHRACERLIDDGVEGILATVISESLPLMCRRLARLAELRDADAMVAGVIRGVHIEGPFLNPADGYRGAHPAEALLPAGADAARRLLDAAAGLTRVFTLAPECDPGADVTRLLAERGILVAAGHTNASTEELTRAADAGMRLFTHLGNGCPMQLARHDNIIQRALGLADRFYFSLIADGVHIPAFALRNYVAAAGVDRCVVVSDAMMAAGLGPGRYQFSRWDLVIGEDLAARSPDGSHLVGSAVTLRRAKQVLVGEVGLCPAAARRLVEDTPRALLEEHS